MTANRMAARLWVAAAPLLDSGSETYRAACQELLDAVIPALAAVAAGDGTPPAAATARIQALAARIATIRPGIDPVVRTVSSLISSLLNLVAAENGTDLPATAREVATAGSRVVTDLLTGAHSTAARELRVRGRSERARELLNGDHAAVDDDHDLSPAYAVIAVHPDRPADARQLAQAFEQAGGDGALTALGSSGGFALLPAENEARALHLARQAYARLATTVWMSVSWRPKSEVVLGRRTSSKILSLVTAAGHQPGVYHLEDVLLEYAVAREPLVSRKLMQIIEPLLAHPALFDTLKVLIASDGNRSQAAEQLLVHRSTLDYRIQRIEQLTGLHPGGVREINILSTAVAAHAAQAQSKPVRRKP